MQIHHSDLDLPNNVKLVCRQSWLTALTGILVCFSLLVGLPVALWSTGALPSWLGIVILFIAAMVTPLFAHTLLATLRSSNWTLAIAPDGLWINLRSYQNYRFPRGETVVHIPFGELASVSRHVAKRSTWSGDGPMSWTETSLNLWLLSTASDRLKTAIAKERGRRTNQKFLGGLITTSGRANHVPVLAPRDNLVRVAWKSRHDFLRPKIDDVLDKLAEHVQVVEDQVQDASDDFYKIPDSRIDERILEFVESGDSFSAVKLLRLRRGYTLTEAKTFVDELNDRLEECEDPAVTADTSS